MWLYSISYDILSGMSRLGDISQSLYDFPADCNTLAAEYYHWVSKNPSLVRYELTHIFEIAMVGLLANPKAFRKGLACGVAEFFVYDYVADFVLNRLIGPKKAVSFATKYQYPTVDYSGLKIHDFSGARTTAFAVPIIEESWI